jgi:membrane protein implicated in regulation of membrane protease activity
MIVTQCWLVLSGNFAWLNVLTITLATPVLGDGLLHHALPFTAPLHLGSPAWWEAVVIAVTVLVLALSYRPARNLVSRRQLMNASFDQLHLVNTYGAFGGITRVRQEVVVEGTADPVITDATTWREYGFKGKPGDLRRRPPQVAPYHLRLDWMMWFAGISPAYARGWFGGFVERLLRNDRDTLKLLRTNPFPDAPPVFVRARLYDYRFTTRSERRQTKRWWDRTLVGEFLRPVRIEPDASVRG